MTDPSRHLVAWAGGKIPVAVARAFGHLELTLQARRADEIRPHDPTLRAVLLRFSRKPRELAALRRRLTQLLPAIDHGAMLAVVTDEGDFAAPSAIAAHVERSFGGRPGRIHTMVLEPYKVALACLRHAPGPAANGQIELGGDLTNVEEEERVLLRRAFHAKFSKLEIHPETGGRSVGTKVWRVTAFLTDGGCCEPFIVKSGRPLAILEEYQTWKELVANHVPFPFRPPLIDVFPIAGVRRSLLVSMFVTRSQRFDQYVTTIAGTPLAISSLFDGPLRTWRENRREVIASLGQAYVEEQVTWIARREKDEIEGRPYLAVLPEPSRLDAPYEAAKTADPDVASPHALYQMLSETRKFCYMQCRGHGDLNARNLFVRWNGLDVILIDFSHAGVFGAASRDPARLEVSLAFDVPAADGSHLSEEFLKRLYDVPLLPYRSAPVHDGRVEAIRQVRTHVAGDGVTDFEYRISVAAHLLRHARTARDCESTPGVLAQKALAYRLAARLIRSTL